MAASLEAFVQPRSPERGKTRTRDLTCRQREEASSASQLAAWLPGCLPCRASRLPSRGELELEGGRHGLCLLLLYTILSLKFEI